MSSANTENRLLDKEFIFRSLMKYGAKSHSFINDGNTSVRRSPDDKLGASLAFSINHFATGFYGSFNKNKCSAML